MHSKTILFFLLLISWLLHPSVALSEELGYRRITMGERIKEFYRCGGKSHLNLKVHILLDASIFRKDPEKIKRPGGVLIYRFSNRSVPVLVDPGNAYYKRFLRQLSRKGKKIKTVSVQGKIVRPEWDGRGRCHLLLYKMKCYGGALSGPS